jgi:tetratricopeptide (TPR) repeat protein
MFDQPLGTSALGIAMTNIYRAINLAPDYINAKSALCYGLIARYTTKREDALLVEAEKACNALKEIAINSPRYHTANGYLQDNLQDLPGAIAAFERALEIEPNFVDAMNGLAETYLTKGSRERSREIILKGLAIANEASKVSPLFWKPPYIKARIYYISGQPDLAISESEKSIEIEPNYANLNNGASINFCFGDPAVALQMYERAVTLKFSRPELHYNLASTYSYFEDYESASEHIDTYFNLLEQENSDANLDGYIGAGDVHRLAQNFEKASELYQIAFSKAENERLQGDESPDLRSKLLYLEIMNATLSSPETVKTKQSEYINQLDDLVPLVVNPNSIMRLLFAYSELSQFDSAKALYLKIAPICKGFADAAAFARFRE